MSFWGSLGRGLLSAIPVIGPALESLTNVGQDASAVESGRAQGRIGESQINGQYDQNRLRAAQLLNDALMNQNQFALGAPRAEMSNAAHGDLLANMQDVGIQGPITRTHGQVPQITGGLRPSLLSANTRQLGQNVSRDMLLRNMNGMDNLNLSGNVPSITPPPQANGFDTALNGIGLAGGLSGGVADFINAIRRRANPYQVPNYGPSGGSGDPNFDNGIG